MILKQSFRQFVNSLTIIVLLATCWLMAACSSPEPMPKVHSMYYWSTTFRMDSTKAKFLSDHNVSRLYVRYFDVVTTDDGELMPNATIRFSETSDTTYSIAAISQKIEIIPTIFIVNNCLERDISPLADRIVKRVLQMNETHDVAQVKEIQIDCDWTIRSQLRYFVFLKELRQQLHRHGLSLSVTIRLHQLAAQAPPADRGVLMMYNTGDFTDLKAEKPILDMRDAAPYMQHLSSYSLPLATAYPLYRWRIVFRQGRYVGLLHHEDDFPMLEGDSIVTRQPELEDIMAAKETVTRLKKEANNEIILFDINTFNITRFSPKEYEKIYSN